jgi:hypothetical protein
MITLFHVTGAYIYVDPDGNAVGEEDAFTKLEAARKHHEAVGLGDDQEEPPLGHAASSEGARPTRAAA